MTFAGWGRFVHRFRWSLLIVSILPLGAALAVMSRGVTYQAPSTPTTIEAGTALALIEADLPARPASFTLIFSHPTWMATDPAFAAEVDRALAPLRADPRVARTLPPDPTSVSRDGHRLRVAVELAGLPMKLTPPGFSALAGDVYPALRALVRSDLLEVLPAGALALNHDFTQSAKDDLRRIELIVLPVVLVLLVLVFGSLVAAGLPLLVGLLALIAGMAGTAVLAYVTPVSIYATNVMTMIGLGVAVDYSLFMVSRFREEVRQHSAADALARTMATAGRALVYAGATVAVGLLGLVFLPIDGVGSMGLAGTIVVGCSVLYSVTFLPAILAILGPRVDAGRLWFLRADRGKDASWLWLRLAAFVMAHPWQVLVPVVALLVLVATPFQHLRLASGDATSLPAGAESRRGEALLREHFPFGDLTQIAVVVDYRDGAPGRADRVAERSDLHRWLAARPNVVRVDETVVGSRIAVLSVSIPFPADSLPARTLVQTIRGSHPALGGELLVTGRTAFDLDFIQVVSRNAWSVIGFVVGATYLVLLVLLRSVVLPLKAVVMNFLSISASYGALVWIFQDGHLATWLDFTPRSIEVVTPIVMFCVLFGLSMDYEVLLLSRIREEYERTGDNEHAVGTGLARTGRLITGAAAIMAAVFFGFGLADTVVIKAMGIGMGLAVVIDATIVRMLLVPAAMKLLGRWNWWAPPLFVRAPRRLNEAGSPDMAPRPPGARSAPAKPWRSSNLPAE
jgi:putative drug exporter of the RND superfamily